MSDVDDELGEEEEMGIYLGEYEGERNEKEERHGHGRAILPNKDIYDGNYLNGKRDGYGVYKFKSKAAKGACYMGEYYQGKKQGFGIFIYPDGSRYEGNFVDGVKEGTGVYYYVNGDTYEGEWSKGLRHGKGTYTYARDNVKYVGSWRKGKWEGFGEFQYANFKYCGRFRDNKMFGHGKYVFDVHCELHGQYVLGSREEAAAADIEQEAYFMASDVPAGGEGEDAVKEGEAKDEEPELRMPPSPPPIGPTHFVTGTLTGLHVMTKEEAEEAAMVEELNALRAKVEEQIAAKEEAKRKKAERLAAKKARQEAERAALEAVAQEGAAAEEVKAADGAEDGGGAPGDESGPEGEGGEKGEPDGAEADAEA